MNVGTLSLIHVSLTPPTLKEPGGKIIYKFNFKHKQQIQSFTVVLGYYSQEQLH